MSKNPRKSAISTQDWTTLLAIFIGRVLPPALGYPVARALGRLVGLFPRGAAYRSLRLNLWVASGKQWSGRELDRAVRQVFLNQSVALYDFYRALSHPEIAQEKVRLSPAFKQLLEECKQQEHANLLLIPHLSGFNLGGLRLVQEQLRYLVLANPDPSKAYQRQNELRNRHGMEVMQFTISALGLARERLQAGGTVLTGIDRPVEGSKYAPRFFGCPAALPVSHIRLAFKTGARVFVVGFTTLKDHTHLLDCSEEIPLERFDDPEEELTRNAEKVLVEAEKFIRRDPLHWMMFFPVWPGELAELEGREG